MEWVDSISPDILGPRARGIIVGTQARVRKVMNDVMKWSTIAAVAGLGSVFAAQAHADYPSFEPRGRMHVDAAFHDKDDVDISDRFLNRRARIGVSGSLDPRWSFIIEYDFAENGTSASDVYIRRALPLGAVTVGQFKVPMGLNELTSSNNITFIERAANSNAIVDARRLGIGYHIDEGDIHFRTMAYGRAIGDDDGTSDGDDMNLGLAGRLVFAPRINGQLFHIGGSIAYEDRRDQNTVRYRERPESRPGNVRLIDTGNITDADSTLKYGLELAYQFGPFSAEAEYLSVKVDRDENRNPTLDGYHVQASYVLTGESRGYRGGNFRGITPARAGGAWEVAARYSNIDLNDAGLEGGEQRNITLGVNYYATANIRFMFNYIFVDVKDSGVMLTQDDEQIVVGDEKPRIALMRAQYSF